MVFGIKRVDSELFFNAYPINDETVVLERYFVFIRAIECLCKVSVVHFCGVVVGVKVMNLSCLGIVLELAMLLPKTHGELELCKFLIVFVILSLVDLKLDALLNVLRPEMQSSSVCLNTSVARFFGAGVHGHQVPVNFYHCFVYNCAVVFFWV